MHPVTPSTQPQLHTSGAGLYITRLVQTIVPDHEGQVTNPRNNSSTSNCYSRGPNILHEELFEQCNKQN